MQRKIRIIAVGKIRNAWVQAGVQEYLKRIPGIVLVEIKDATPEKEAAEILALLKPQEKLIVLTERGRLLSSLEFATFVDQAVTQDALAFAIGGPVGISPSLAAAATQTLSLSPMTFTHEIARLLLVEQLYRAHTILHHGNYHK